MNLQGHWDCKVEGRARGVRRKVAGGDSSSVRAQLPGDVQLTGGVQQAATPAPSVSSNNTQPSRSSSPARSEVDEGGDFSSVQAQHAGDVQQIHSNAGGVQQEHGGDSGSVQARQLAGDVQQIHSDDDGWFASLHQPSFIPEQVAALGQ